MRRAASAALLAAVGCFAPARAADFPSDPQDLLREAAERIAHGDLRAAAEATAALRALIEADRDWDPDGGLAAERLPELEARLARLGAAAQELDALPRRLAAELVAPEACGDPEALPACAAWADDSLERLRAARGRILEAVADPADRAALLRTKSYARAQRFLETEVMHRIAAALETVISGLVKADERTRVLRARLDAMKRDAIAAALERDRLENELRASEERGRAYLESLWEMVQDAGGEPIEPTELCPEEVSRAFGDLLGRRLESVRELPSQSRLEKALREEEIRRYRSANVACARAGIAPDRSEWIDALEAVVKDLPVDDTGSPAAATGWFACCFSQCRQQ